MAVSAAKIAESNAQKNPSDTDAIHHSRRDQPPKRHQV
jgi:hypothetical protein